MRCCTVLCLLMASGTLAANGQGVGRERGLSLRVDDPKSRQAVVARVGDLAITAQQFMLSYEFSPAFVKRSRQSKKRHLEFLINEKLLALDAYSRRAQVYPRIAATLADIEGDLATEELFLQDVQSKVRVTQKEIARGAEDSRREVVARWIYFPDSLQIVDAVAAIRRGAPFDSLYRLQGPDSMLNTDRLLETNLFKLRMKNAPFAAVVDTLPPQHVSAPIKAPDGWYLVKSVGGSRDVLTTESGEAATGYDVQRALFQYKADSASNAYVIRLMESKKPVIEPATFEQLLRYLALTQAGPDHARAWGLLGPEPADSIDAARIMDSGKLVLVRLSGKGRVFLADFLRWFGTRSANVKLNTTGMRAYTYSCEQLVWRMVRDKLLVDRALARRMHERPAVRLQKKWWEEKLMYEAEKQGILDSISLQDEAVREFYTAHASSYRDTLGQPLTFESARDDVLRDYYDFELTRRLFHRITSLKKKYVVTVKDSVLSRIPVEEDEPHAIDVYAVKKGGTFPRPAFPTIDFQWRTWY